MATQNDYLRLKPNYLKNKVQALVKYLKQPKIYRTFDAIAFRGVSGALVAPAVAMALNKNLLVVRKTKDNAHSSCLVEGSCLKAYIIIDDFIDTGETVEAIIENIKDDFDDNIKCAGIYTYSNNFNGYCVSDKIKKLRRNFCLKKKIKV